MADRETSRLWEWAKAAGVIGWILCLFLFALSGEIALREHERTIDLDPTQAADPSEED